MRNEHVLVIGGSKGSGRTFAQMMLKKGYAVSIISRNAPVNKIKGALHLSADITKPTEYIKVFNEIIKKQGKLNHLVFCHQFRGPGDPWDGQLETALSAVKYIVESAVPHFNNGPQGKTIVMVSSIASHLIAIEQPVGYHVAKAGLEQMARYYALLLGPKGFRVNVVAPNMVLKDENKEFYTKNKTLHDLHVKISPLKRMVRAEDVANTIAFFCSPASDGVTGQSLVVDAGVSLQEHVGLARKLVALDGIQITQKKK